MQDSLFPHPGEELHSTGGRSICCTVCGGRFYIRDGVELCPECGRSTRFADEQQATVIMADPREIDAEEVAACLPDEMLTIPSTLTFLPAGDPDALGRGPDLLETADEFLERIGAGVHVYRFETLLGAGGMGRVYLARHGDLRRRCAVKVLSPRLARDDVDYVERFQNEGRAAAALNHPNIVVTHAIGVDRGFHFLEMEYLPGGSLRQVLRDRGIIPPQRATHLVQRIAEGLATAHRHGIVHRDLKSDNVMLTLAGVPKISDFGLAKTLNEADDAETRTLAGTPTFMAPELFSGAPASPASDVYALGVIYFELLTGHVPFTGESFAELRRSVQNDPLPSARELVKNLPLEMAECLALMLEKCPTNRPPGGAAAAQLLAAVAGNVPDLDSLLADAFRERPEITWARTGESYTIRIPLRDGRKQDVIVEPNGLAASEQLLVISSVCCPAVPSYYEEALRLNGVMPHGSIAIHDVDGTPMFRAVNTYPRETADPEEVRRSVLELARRADSIEHLLTSQDQH